MPCRIQPANGSRWVSASSAASSFPGGSMTIFRFGAALLMALTLEGCPYVVPLHVEVLSRANIRVFVLPGETKDEKPCIYSVTIRRSVESDDVEAIDRAEREKDLWHASAPGWRSGQCFSSIEAGRLPSSFEANSAFPVLAPGKYMVYSEVGSVAAAKKEFVIR